MRRREFIAFVATVAWSVDGSAQEVRKIARIGILGFGGPGEPWVASA
jgi:hypothetical protein